ncbi:MAG: ABC transporter permease [Bacilli bacterium]
MSTYSDEHQIFLKRRRKRKYLIIFSQVVIIIAFLTIWQLCASFGLINTFMSSSPKDIFSTIFNLAKANQLSSHILVTLYETLISFSIAGIVGLIIATILWWYPFSAKVFDPYLTIINSLPKVALGPLIIIWVGASINSIIFMALMISLIITVINIYNGFISTDQDYITLLKSFNASKKQMFLTLILPSNRVNIINSLKINISMSLIGVIMGELLVSKQGLGYLIMYGSQVFNINLVITSVVILGLMSYLMYYIINFIEKRLSK